MTDKLEADLTVVMTGREDLRDKVKRLEDALNYIWDRCGPHSEFPPCRDAAERAMIALGVEP